MKKVSYGKIVEAGQEGTTVFIRFENGELEVTAYTDFIIRIFSDLSGVRPASHGIEGDKKTDISVRMEESEGCVTVSTKELTVKVRDGAGCDFYDKDGKALCMDYPGERVPAKKLSDQMRQLMEQEGHTVEDSGAEHRIQVVKRMDQGDCFYGLGDKTGFLNKRGYEYVSWNTDDPNPHVDSYKSLYKSIPFFITLKQDGVFGLFFDNTYRTFFDFGKESDDYYFFAADEGNLNYYFIGGDSMQDVVKGYTYLTGRAPLPQLWTLGYHQSRWGYCCEEDVRGIAENMRKHKIPCDAVHLDIDYMRGYRVFTVDKEKFPDIRGLTEDMGRIGMRLVTIIDPGVKKDAGYAVYDEGVEKGYFAKTPEGEIYENVVWPGAAVYPDFGREEVRKWWGENHRYLVENGIAGIWNDMNEPASFNGELPEDVVFFEEERKTCHSEVHNVYGHNMARATYAGLKELTGKRPFVITRACYSGSQKYTIGWTGDNQSLWAHLQMAIPQLCNLGVSGMPYVGTDIGGFGADTTKELLCRWIELGSLSPFCRNHCSFGNRVQEPWTFDEETTEIYRKYLKLRYALLPYLYDLFRQEEESGLPLMRPMVLQYEKDAETRNMNGQFMIGESLLAAPVVEQGATRKMVYLPEGDWYDYQSGEKLEGGRYVIRKAALEECPLFVKAGSIIPHYPEMDHVSKEKDKELILRVYPGEGEYLHYQDNGEDFAYREGAYNLYHVVWKDGKAVVTLTHRGYAPVYEKVLVRCGEDVWEAEIL